MKKVNLTLILFVLSVFASAVNADIAFKTPDEVEGNWKLKHTRRSMVASGTIKREDTWVFEGGKVTISHIPRDGTYFDQPPVDYKIEDGKLKISILGRPDKFEVFSLMEKDDNNMTLKAKFGDIYQFMKK